MLQLLDGEKVRLFNSIPYHHLWTGYIGQAYKNTGICNGSNNPPHSRNRFSANRLLFLL